MKERVYIHTVEVSKRGQVIYFQVKLPRDAKKIIGIHVTENSALVLSDSDVVPTDPKSGHLYSNIKVGRLKLKTRNRCDNFFYQDIIRNDNSLMYGDFSNVMFYNNETAEGENFYTHDWWLAGGKVKAQPLEIDIENTKLFGTFTDAFNTFRGTDSGYQVNIYLYYQQKEKENENRMCA